MDSKFGWSLLLVISVSWEVHATVNCTETGVGYFADPDDTTCQSYTRCIRNRGFYISYNYVCPYNYVFNPTTTQCTSPSNYDCNVSTTNTTTSCSADGFFTDPSSTNCSSYIECINLDGSYEETIYTCPNNTYYNPNTTLCDSNYDCSTGSFMCTVAGRFANSSDSTCKTYYFCVLTSDGTFIQLSYTCPSTSVFSPNSKICTTSYTC